MNNRIIKHVVPNAQDEKEALKYFTSWKEEKNRMEKHLRIYTDDLIRVHKEVSTDGHYDLKLSDLPAHEIASFVAAIHQNDPEFKAMLDEQMDALIKQRITFVECEDMYQKGLCPSVDGVNGEVKWVRR
jgi:hypothetical protein